MPLPTSIDRPTMENPRTPQMVMAAIEQCLCLRCPDSPVIPTQNVRIENTSPSAYRPPQQTVLAWCEHCGTLYQLHRVMLGAVYIPSSDVMVVEDKKLRREFFNRLSLLRGDVLRTAG